MRLKLNSLLSICHREVAGRQSVWAGRVIPDVGVRVSSCFVVLLYYIPNLFAQLPLCFAGQPLSWKCEVLCNCSASHLQLLRRAYQSEIIKEQAKCCSDRPNSSIRIPQTFFECWSAVSLEGMSVLLFPRHFLATGTHRRDCIRKSLLNCCLLQVRPRATIDVEPNRRRRRHRNIIG